MPDFIRVGGIKKLQDGEFIIQVSYFFNTYRNSMILLTACKFYLYELEPLGFLMHTDHYENAIGFYVGN